MGIVGKHFQMFANKAAPLSLFRVNDSGETEAEPLSLRAVKSNSCYKAVFKGCLRVY